MTPIEALYQRAPVSPDGAAFIVGDDKWKYGWLAAQAERLARGLTGLAFEKAIVSPCDHKFECSAIGSSTRYSRYKRSENADGQPT
jgi:hypothetical protein